jgi:iron(III) transport system ATP-binding protein
MIEVSGLTKLYGKQVLKAIDNVNFTVEAGSFFTLLGPSGCGKTTTMRCIAGLIRPEAGRIRFGATTVYDASAGVCLPTAKRPIGMVFQSYAIWPHMTLFDNVAYPLRVKRASRGEVTRRVTEALEKVGLGGLGARPAPMLSGGQQQRAALARAIVAEPEILILDEPLSNLDAGMRVQMRTELKRLQQTLGVTTVYVTHDQEEALAMSDTIAVMRNGALIQMGKPEEIYDSPRSQFVASFIGQTNMIAGAAGRAIPGGEVGTVESEVGPLQGRNPAGEAVSGPVCLSVRPEGVTLGAADTSGSDTSGSDTSRSDTSRSEAGQVHGTVTERVYLGGTVHYVVTVAGRTITSRRPSVEAPHSVGDPVTVTISPRAAVVIPDEPAAAGGQEQVTVAGGASKVGKAGAKAVTHA